MWLVLCLATTCLQWVATGDEVSFRVAAKLARKNFYVDDLLTGNNSVDDGKTLVTDLISLTNSAGFIPRKWSSNSYELLSTIPAELQDERCIGDRLWCLPVLYGVNH